MTWTGDEFNGTVLDPKWLWLNQGGATTTVANGQLTISAPANGAENLRFLYQPYSGALTVTAPVSGRTGTWRNYISYGLAVRDSSSLKMTHFRWGVFDPSLFTWGLQVAHYSSPTATPSSAFLTQKICDGGGYLQIQDDGTNLIFLHSRFGSQGDGGALTFVELYRETKASWLTAADQLGMAVNAFNFDIAGTYRWIRTGTPQSDAEVVP